MRKITSLLVAGAFLLFMGGCAPANTDIDFFTAPPDTASVSATESPDMAVTQPTDAPADTEPTDASATQDVSQPTDTATDQPADTTQDVEPSDNASTAPDQSVDTTDDSSDGADQPQDADSPAPTKTVKPSATPSADASSSGGESSAKALSAEKVTGTAQVSDYLSLRASASATADVVTKIPKDAKLTITGVDKDSTWLKVKYSDKSGYVLAKYVQVNGSSKNKVCVAISSGALNVRSGAGTTKKLLGTVKAGTTMVVTEVVKGSPDSWYKVILSGTTGYVSAKYCRIAS